MLLINFYLLVRVDRFAGRRDDAVLGRARAASVTEIFNAATIGGAGALVIHFGRSSIRPPARRLAMSLSTARQIVRDQKADHRHEGASAALEEAQAARPEPAWPENFALLIMKAIKLRRLTQKLMACAIGV